MKIKTNNPNLTIDDVEKILKERFGKFQYKRFFVKDTILLYDNVVMNLTISVKEGEIFSNSPWPGFVGWIITLPFAAITLGLALPLFQWGFKNLFLKEDEEKIEQYLSFVFSNNSRKDTPQTHTAQKKRALNITNNFNTPLEKKHPTAKRQSISSSEKSINKLFQRARALWLQGNMREASVLINKILKQDILHQGAWEFLHVKFGKGKTFVTFQQEFANKYYPENVHLLGTTKNDPIATALFGKEEDIEALQENTFSKTLIETEKFCSQCNHKKEGSSNFCTYCGNPFEIKQPKSTKNEDYITPSAQHPENASLPILNNSRETGSNSSRSNEGISVPQEKILPNKLKKCPHCGNTIDAKSVFCTHCGHSKDARKARPIPNNISASRNPNNQQDNLPQHQDNTKKKVSWLVDAGFLFANIAGFFLPWGEVSTQSLMVLRTVTSVSAFDIAGSGLDFSFAVTVFFIGLYLAYILTRVHLRLPSIISAIVAVGFQTFVFIELADGIYETSSFMFWQDSVSLSIREGTILGLAASILILVGSIKSNKD